MKSMSKRRWYLFRLIILIQCKKMLLCFKTSFVGLKKIVFFFSSPFMRLFCCWFSFFLHVVASVLVGLCNVLSDLRFFFIHLLIFFNDLMKYYHGFFSPLFFLWNFLCLVSLSFFLFQFFLNGIKKKIL